MEILPSFVITGGIKLPIGYRFCPTDEELIVHYLRKLAFGLPLPAAVIPVLDVFQTDPWKLPGVGEADSVEKGYFFSEMKDIFYGGIIVIAEGTGFWKPTGKEKLIVSSATNYVVGTRRTLVFCGGDGSGEAQTQWVMHELRLAGPPIIGHPSKMPWTKWAVYRVFQKEKKPKRKRSAKQSNIKKVQKLEGVEPSFIDFTADDHGSDEAPPPPPSPSVSEGSDTIASN
ncbi:NAC domain-containing protein 83-like [Prosopis cineraria]|uniref:NAC domain-containing protein 83-like n=1 Tax=Prosopis cineraria TaxID=364024 RepID=UPI00240FA06D|nr:NAC domain-containing protein 83-like [Prosopis cineraria]